MPPRRKLKKKIARRQLTVVNPAFDPVAKVWFVEGLSAEGRSIPELLTQLPKGTTIGNYYPLGTTCPRPQYENSGLRRVFGGARFTGM